MAIAYGFIATGGVVTLAGLVALGLVRNAMHFSARI